MVLNDYISQAIDINVRGVKLPKKKIVVTIPDELQKALDNNAEINTYFNSLAPSHQRDFTEWISDAKQEKTKLKRLNQTIELLVAKTTRHAKYKNNKKKMK